MTTRRNFLAGAAAIAIGGCSSEKTDDRGTITPGTPTPSPTPTPTAPPVQSAYVLATKDGSVGQTYSVSSDLTGIQWFREALTADRTRTPIDGASGTTYVAQSADVGSRIVARGKLPNADVDARALAVVLPLPVILASFDDVSELTIGNEAIASNVATGQVQGTGCILLQGTGSNRGGPSVGKPDIGTHDPSTFGTIVQYFNVGFDPSYTTSSSIGLRFSRGGTTYSVEPNFIGPLYQTPQPLFFGSMWASRHVSEFGTLSTIGSGSLGFETVVVAQAPNAPKITADAVIARAGGRPTIVLGFDDMIDNQYAVAFSYMQQRKMKGGIHLIPNRFDTAARLTLAEFKEMYAAGWDCYLNATADDGAITSQPTVAAAIQTLNEIRAFAVANGFPRGNDFVAFPNGVFQTTTARVLVFTVRTNGTTIATMTSTAGIVAGMIAAGYNVPPGTTVVSVDSGTQITLSNAVVSQGKQYSFTAPQGEFGYGKLPQALKAAGYKMGRTTQGSGGAFTRFGITDRGGILTPTNATSSLSLDRLKALVDQTILRGETCEFYTHGISAAGGVQTDQAKFTGLIDYLAEKRDAGQLDVLTKTELWMRDGSASVPV